MAPIGLIAIYTTSSIIYTLRFSNDSWNRLKIEVLSFCHTSLTIQKRTLIHKLLYYRVGNFCWETDCWIPIRFECFCCILV